MPTADPANGLIIGSLAVTVTDRLRVRSQPRVSDDSVMYEPLLPSGTELLVVGGPVQASDYTWFEVEPVSFVLDGGVTRGWVAIADKGGEPWVAPAEAPIAGLAVAKSAVARATADPSMAKGAGSSINAFGIDIYQQMLNDPSLDLAAKNAVFSPTSIALALGMTRAGARGETASQMDAVLHTAGWDELSAGLNALDQALARRNATWTDEEATRQLALRIANTTFAQRDWSIEPAFLDAIAAAFGAGVNLVDYQADPEAAREAINTWVSRRTEQRIPELLLPPNVSVDTRLYLVNAIYLKAEWDSWFDDEATKPATFTKLDGSTVQVPTMVTNRGSSYPAYYATGNGWQAVELSYRGANNTRPLAMMLIRPDDLAAFEAGLTAAQLEQISGALGTERDRFATDIDCPPAFEGGCYPYDLRLFMPRFSIETRAGLKDVLTAAGMPLAFDPDRADFTGIHRPSGPGDGIHIGGVIHQANIDVDEKGTEAAAATAVGMDTGGGPSALESLTVRLDRPFLFALRDVETGAILFMGRVVDPSVTR